MRNILWFFLLAALSMKGQPIVFQNGVPRDTSFNLMDTFRKEKKYRPYITLPADTLPAGVIARRGIVYSTPAQGRGLKLDIYRPGDKWLYPVLLMIHGGGWSSGTPRLQDPMAKRIAAAGYVAIPVEYRLSPEALYPAAVFDLKRAVRWIRANASEYGFRSECIAVSGCSAGGQLASLLGATNGNPHYDTEDDLSEFSSVVQAVINIDGSLDFTHAESARKASDDYKKGKVVASVKWLASTVESNRTKWEEASPLYQVTAQSAPVCFINSSIPRFHDGRDEMIATMQEYGIYTEINGFDDTPHPFWLFNPWFEPTVDIMIRFLDKQFK